MPKPLNPASNLTCTWAAWNHLVEVKNGVWASTRSRSIYDNEYTYAGRRLDKETGIYCYRHRVYLARTRIGDEPDRAPLEGTQGDRQVGWLRYLATGHVMERAL